MKSCVALLTDFGLIDPYVGMMKAVLLNKDPGANLIDLTHGVEAQNIKQAAFILGKSFEYFHEDTIFLCVVDPGVGSERLPIAIKTDKYYFIGPDNGIFTEILGSQKIEDVRIIDNPRIIAENPSATFHGRDIFAPTAGFLAWGGDFSRIGESINPDSLQLLRSNKKVSKNEITGEIIFADHFGNLISDIDPKDIEKLNSNKIEIQIGDHKIKKISNTFSDIATGEVLAYISSYSTLAIGANQANAKEIISAITGSAISIKSV
jgi:S-adenosyl-L-methionine hydrolase (adenosine-forming)